MQRTWNNGGWRRTTLTLASVLALWAAWAVPGSLAAAEPDRSPVDLVIGGDGAWLATVNQTAGTVSLVDIAGERVLAETPVGGYPVAIALTPDGRTLAVTSRDTGELVLLQVADGRLAPLAAVSVGFEPHGVAISADGARAYVALFAADAVAVVDLAKREVVSRIDAGRQPRYLALSPDGRRLAIGSAADRGISVVDVADERLDFTTRFAGMNFGHMQVSNDGAQVYFPWMVYRDNPITASNIRRGWVLASRLGRQPLGENVRRDAISLDPSGAAVADPHGLALSSDESTILITAGGTQELLFLQAQGLPWLDHGSTDHIERELLNDRRRFSRLTLGGRPQAVRITADDRTAYVANYLRNSVQVVDVAERKLVGEIALGGPAEPSLVRRGEAIFYDGRRSLDTWYSCHSCHYEGGTNSRPIDTMNDGSAFTFKTVLPLYGVGETGPWFWHGWQTSLDDAAGKSLTSTMLGPEPSRDEVRALVAYLKSLTLPPNPFRQPDGSLTPAAERGRAVFESAKAGCATCHNGPHYTDNQIHEVGLGSPRDRYRGFNTPSLLGVYRRPLLTHDGRASSLEELLTGPHAPEQVAGEGKLTADELRDLVEFLKSL